MSLSKDRVTIYDIARAAGVSPSTVSRVFNNQKLVNKDTKEKVLKVVKEYQYQPNSIARTLHNKESKSIGILVESIKTPYFNHSLTLSCTCKYWPIN